MRLFPIYAKASFKMIPCPDPQPCGWKHCQIKRNYGLLWNLIPVPFSWYSRQRWKRAETIKFTPESMAQIADLIENPPEPTEALRRLFRDE